MNYTPLGESIATFSRCRIFYGFARQDDVMREMSFFLLKKWPHMSNDVLGFALTAGAIFGPMGGLISLRKDRWIAFVIATGAGILGGISSNRLLMATEAVAPRFVLIDSSGITRAQFGVSNEDSARLRLIDRGGNEYVRLDAGFGSQGPCFFFNDSHDKPLVAFCARDDHTAVLDLRGPDEQLL
jgi:hypothetical protein